MTPSEDSSVRYPPCHPAAPSRGGGLWGRGGEVVCPSRFADGRTEPQRRYLFPKAHSKGQWEGCPRWRSAFGRCILPAEPWGSGTSLFPALGILSAHTALCFNQSPFDFKQQRPILTSSNRGFFFFSILRRTLTLIQHGGYGDRTSIHTWPPRRPPLQ